MNNYGIFLAYPPTTDLRNQGLGRYLAAFLNGGCARDDVRFTLVCPSWAKEGLLELFQAEGVPEDGYEIHHPTGLPIILRIYEKYQKIKKNKKGKKIKNPTKYFTNIINSWTIHVISRISKSYSIIDFLLASIEAMVMLGVFAIASPFVVVGLILHLIFNKKYFDLLRGKSKLFNHLYARLTEMLDRPKDDGLIQKMYGYMEDAETERMLRIVKKLKYIQAWYCPTAFWPAFNKIDAPRVMCVPDVVLTEFPSQFAKIGGERYLKTFETIETAIHGCEYFITYSEHVKWETLVRRYGVDSGNVIVIPHAAQNISRWIMAEGTGEKTAVIASHAKWLLSRAFTKNSRLDYLAGFQNMEVKYIFYASQARPNKNIVTLLRAYEYLLRKRYIGHKLVLTGDSADWEPVKKFVKNNALENDVLFLCGLSVSELAACYKLAELSVNPSLSEGGCPFTFTEALSVGTPVVMAKIPVTMEVITDSNLQELMLFDPFSWQEMAKKIEWALKNKNKLLDIQLDVFMDISKRTWSDVVDEHIAALDLIAGKNNDPKNTLAIE